ncbi:MAG: CHRD domain-containing protein [Candidatus Nitrosocosmicus sp.]|nr:CHRD domain-containing protein [Candidatus Nitrosocosmicus sp.]
MANNTLKNTFIMAVLSITAITITAYSFSATNGLTLTSVYAQTSQQQPTYFDAKLAGDQEVPPVDTQGSGQADFNVVGTDSISYDVNVTGMEKVTQAHIHKGKTGENGPVVVTLFNTESPSATTNGVLASGNFTAADFEGPLKGKQMKDLTDMVNDGEAYVNVHTEANPKGEIRGQLSFM